MGEGTGGRESWRKVHQNALSCIFRSWGAVLGCDGWCAKPRPFGDVPGQNGCPPGPGWRAPGCTVTGATAAGVCRGGSYGRVAGRSFVGRSVARVCGWRQCPLGKAIAQCSAGGGGVTKLSAGLAAAWQVWGGGVTRGWHWVGGFGAEFWGDLGIHEGHEGREGCEGG